MHEKQNERNEKGIGGREGGKDERGEAKEM